MMSKRIMGKASFSDMRDRYGRLQLYIKRDNVGEDVYKGYKKFDIGDIIGIEGEVFRTQKGEISVSVTELTLLSKNLAPLPEKWHGLKDTDMRYRQRYVDLIVNPEVRDTFEKRSAIVREIRNFMDSRGFMEVETPCLNTIPGGAAARPFITHHNALDIDMYLRIATELHLKRLIVGGLERVYEIGRIFRNEGMDTRHNPEFTTIELYQAYTDYHGMMDITEDMVIHVCEKVLGSTKVMYQGVEIDFSKGWKRMTMAEAVKEYAGIDFMALSPEEALEAVKAKGLEIEKGKESWGDLMALLLDIRDNAGQRADIAAHRTGLHGLHGSLADGVLRALDVHARQLGGLEEQRFHRHLQTRENRAALIRAVLVDGIKGGRRADIYDDERLAVLANRRNRVDQSVRADLARVGIAVFNADIRIAACNDRLHKQILADGVDERVHHRRHYGRDNDRSRIRTGDIVEVIILRDQHAQLIRGALRIGGNVERAAQLVSVI